MRTMVYGDVHGCGEELQALLEQEKVQPGIDRVYLVGDVFDRARHGHVVWDLIKKYNMTVTLGNHELKFLKYLSGNRLGGVPPHYYWTLNNLINHGVSVAEFYDFLTKMPLLVEVSPGVIVTHAGVNIDDPYREEEGANVYGNIVPNTRPMPRPHPGDKDVYWWDQYKGDPLILYGHLVTHDNKARIRKSPKGEINSIGLDTATCHSGPMTAYCIETKTVHQYCSGIDYFVDLKREFKVKQPEPSEVILEFINSKLQER